MNKVIKLTVSTAFLGSMLALASCSIASISAPGLRTNGLDLAKADYSISAETTGKACKTRVFGVIWSDLFSSKYGSIGYYPQLDYVASVATNDALSKVPGATYAVEPRVEETTSGLYPVFGERCVTVKARAVTLGNGPAR